MGPPRSGGSDAAPAARPRRTYPLMTARQVEGLIAEGRQVIVIDQHVLKVDTFVKFHPGGNKAIQHMVGKDATDEVNA